MVRLLLLLLLGTVYAQEHDDCQHDPGEIVDPSFQEEEEEDGDDEMPEELDDTDLNDFNNITLKIKGESDEATCHYRLHTNPRRFIIARRNCRCNRGVLCSIPNACVNSSLRSLIRNSRQTLAWIGVWKPFRCRGYRTIDGSSLSYTNFGCGQRKARGRWCVAMNVSNGLWVSVSCRRKLPYICRV